jgi:hypothetical protein
MLDCRFAQIKQLRRIEIITFIERSKILKGGNGLFYSAVWWNKVSGKAVLENRFNKALKGFCMSLNSLKEFPFDQVRDSLVRNGAVSKFEQALTYCGSDGGPIIIIVFGGVIIIHNPNGPIPDPDHPTYFGSLSGLVVHNNSFNASAKDKMQEILKGQNVPTNSIEEIMRYAK